MREFLLGLAVQLAYLFLDPQMPFVNQVFVIFRAFYMDQPTAIVALPHQMENEDQLEANIFLKPFRGSRASKSIIPIIRRKKNKLASKIQQHLLEAAADLEAGQDFEDEHRGEAVMAKTHGDTVFRSAGGFNSHCSTIQPFFRSTAASFVSKQYKTLSKTQPGFAMVAKKNTAGSLVRTVIDPRLLTESNPVTVTSKDSKFMTFYKVTTTKSKAFVQNEADQVVGKSISISQLKRPSHKTASIMPVVTKINLGFGEDQLASQAPQQPTPRQTHIQPAYKHSALRPVAQAPDRPPKEAPANKYHVLRGTRTASQQPHLPQPQTPGLNSSDSRMPRLGRSKGSTGTMGTLLGHRVAFDSRAMHPATNRRQAAQGGQSDRQHLSTLNPN